MGETLLPHQPTEPTNLTGYYKQWDKWLSQLSGKDRADLQYLHAKLVRGLQPLLGQELERWLELTCNYDAWRKEQTTNA